MERKISILGINCAYHESAACLIQDGQLTAFVEEERLNRIKHAKHAKVDNSDELPDKSIEYCLKTAGFESLGEIDYIGYSFNPEKRLEKNTQYQSQYKILDGNFGTSEGERIFYEKNLHVKKKLTDAGFNGRFLYLDHHDCHAASTFFLSDYEKAAVLVIDGIGEFESTTSYNGHNNTLKKLGSFNFPDSLGLLWEKMSAYLGFSPYDAAKVMGLSSYGEPGIYKKYLEKLLQINADGSFTIDDTIAQLRNDNFAGLEALFCTHKRDIPPFVVNEDTQKYSDIAVALQIATEDIFIKLAKTLKKKTAAKYLCIAGGVGLNCVANGYLSYEGDITAINSLRVAEQKVLLHSQEVAFIPQYPARIFL